MFQLILVLHQQLSVPSSAYNAGKAPKIIPESTNSIALKYTTLDVLKKYF